MANQYVNKVIIGTEVKLDLSQDDVTPANLALGVKAHDKTGAPITGTNKNDTETGEITTTPAEVLAGKEFGAGGEVKTGTMPNKGAQHLKITTLSPMSIPMGFHDGSGDAAVADSEAAKIVPNNIREGVTILGVEGNMSGNEGMKPQNKNVTPTFEEQEILPDSEYNCLSSVKVAAIPVTYTDNPAGGQTLKVGA